MARIVELVVLLNALGGLGAFGYRAWRRRSRTPLEHVLERDREDAAIDEALERMRMREGVKP